MSDKQKIMDEFPFEEIAARMEQAGWQWSDTTIRRRHVPSVYELRLAAQNLMNMLEGHTQVSTGGFTIERSGEVLTMWFGRSKHNVWAKVQSGQSKEMR